jgi:hypothetical protein
MSPRALQNVLHSWAEMGDLIPEKDIIQVFEEHGSKDAGVLQGNESHAHTQDQPL